MNWCHRQKRQKNAGEEKRKDIPKIGTDCHLDILGHIGIDLASFYQTFLQNHEVLVKQNDICCFLGNIDSCINRNTNICYFHRRRIIDAITHVANLVAIGLELENNPSFLVR